MRIVLLTLILVLPYFYFKSSKPTVGPQIDAIKLKLGAPERTKEDRILTAKEIVKPAADEAPVYEESEEEVQPATEPVSLAGSSIGDLEQVQVENLPDLEEGWNNELKSMLSRLEPIDGDNIYKSWQSEQEGYQAEMDALLNEKQQVKIDGGLEVDQMIEQLEEKHQTKLKDILGAHYEAVRDQYEDFMEASQSETH